MADGAPLAKPGSASCCKDAGFLVAPTASPELRVGEELKASELPLFALPAAEEEEESTCADLSETNDGRQTAEAADEPEQGFQSGLGIRKALRKHWGATVKLWDDGLKDLSQKVQSIKPPTPPPDDSSRSGSGYVDGGALVCDAHTQPTEEAVEAAGEDAGASISGDAEGDAVEHSPWSPVVRPLSKAMEDAKSMGVKLADIWDMHDILDDVRQQRDYWRRRREERRTKELPKGAEAQDGTFAGKERSASAEASALASGILLDIVDDIGAASNKSGVMEPEGEGEGRGVHDEREIDGGPSTQVMDQDALHLRPVGTDVPRVVPADVTPKGKEARRRHRFRANSSVAQANQDAPVDSDTSGRGQQWRAGESTVSPNHGVQTVSGPRTADKAAPGSDATEPHVDDAARENSWGDCEAASGGQAAGSAAPIP